MKFKILNFKFKIAILIAMVFLLAFAFKTLAFDPPSLSEGTYLKGQTLSVWPSWSLLGSSAGAALPVDPINKLGIAGTCSTTKSKFCVSDENCKPPNTPANETCVLHDPATGWSAIDRRFSFACSPSSFAYRYIAPAGSSGNYQLRAKLENTGLNIANWGDLEKELSIDASKIIITDQGACLMNEEISTMEGGKCGDGRINLDKGEQCDPPGYKKYDYSSCASPADSASVTACGVDCRWLAPAAVSCKQEAGCGNGRLDPGETCDDGALNGKYNHCNATCSGVSSLRCGDKIVSAAYEVCDICERLSDVDCAAQLGKPRYTPQKENSCNWDCQAYGPYCGDKIVNGPEECDGNQPCQTPDNKPGALVCGSGCVRQDVSAAGEWTCSPNALASLDKTTEGICGNGKVDPSEICDRGAENGVVCAPSYNKPCSYCSNDCQNIIEVQPKEYCGNGQIEGNEICDTDPSSGKIYARDMNSATTYGALVNGGYEARTCAAEPQDPYTFKKGEKICDNCKAIKLKTTGESKCVKCGLDMAAGTVVEGYIINVLDLAATRPLWAQPNNSLGLLITPSTAAGAIVSAIKTNPGVSFYLGKPGEEATKAKVNSNPICSTGDPRYQMAVNFYTPPGQTVTNFPIDNNKAHWLDFNVFSDPQNNQPWRNDMALSPVINKNDPRQAKNVRVVVSWAGSAEFYSGFIIPAAGSAPVEGLSFKKIAGGKDYFTLAAYDYSSCRTAMWPCQIDEKRTGFKLGGVWYHGASTTPNSLNEESFTIDTTNNSGGDENMKEFTYAFYIRTPDLPISPYRNSAKLKVEVYIPENDAIQEHFAKPVKTFYLNGETMGSENPSASYWQVFNIDKDFISLEQSVKDINSIFTGPQYFKYAGVCTGKPSGALCDNGDACTTNDYCNGTGACVAGPVKCADATYACNVSTGFNCVCSAGTTECGNTCRSTSLVGQDCDDYNPCAVGDKYTDFCGRSCAGTVNEPSCAICKTSSQCEDDKTYTKDSCDTIHNVCSHSRTASCLNSSDCVDGNPYTLDICSLSKCVYTPNGYW